ncbi:MAG: glycine cleavage system aminomethyltransferase GcvT [Candidatus Sumerlaeia bacterium]|nr:glycine cleavage system aminomethyltransferase GcvT [Candidatus Sumerlaeia bacterium]
MPLDSCLPDTTLIVVKRFCIKMNETPLTRWHQEHGARMTDFHGWLMPLQYTSITDEHLAVRRAAGLFDLCHMGRICLRGPDAVAFAHWMTTADVKAMAEGQVDYGFLCNPQGGIVDDITVYRNTNEVMLVVNGANRLKVMDWLTDHCDRYSVEIEDASGRLAMIAIQGPQAVAILQEETRFPLSAIRYYHFAPAEVAGVPMLVSRTGYTGEDGFELYLDAGACEAVWEKLMTPDKKIGDLVAVGLGARDTLRLEASMPLYGNELNDETTPFEAGLGKFVRMDKEDFMGRSALVQKYNAPARRLCCLVMSEKCIPRSGYKVYAGETAIGEVTSGTFSPTLLQGIAMAYVGPPYAKEGTVLAVEIRGRKCAARVVRRPFYSRKRMQSI